MTGAKRSILLSPWTVAWSILLAICIVASFITRASYTDFSSDQEALMGLRYKYISYTTEEIERIGTFIESTPQPSNNLFDADNLINASELIIECEFTGERQYSYLAFLSQVKVVRVIKGDIDLTGKEIKVYEPVAIENRDITVYSGAEQAALIARFGDVRQSDFYQLETHGAYTHGVPMMVENERYILFLNERRYPEQKDTSSILTEYVLPDSPYSKLSLASAETYGDTISPEVVTLAETAPYNIFAEDLSSLQAYIQECKALLQRLETKWPHLDR